MSQQDAVNDPYSIAEPGRSTTNEVQYRKDMETYFAESSGSNVEKLQNFAKYVPRQSITTFMSKFELFKQVLDVQGSIVECGVLAGGGLMTFAQLSSILEPVNFKRQIIGFDTFTGNTELSKEDSTATSVFAKAGEIAADSYDDLRRCIQLYDSNRFIGHIPKVVLGKGDVKDTIPQYIEDKPHTVVSLLYLDVDIFEPTKIAIEQFIPRMPQGSIIAFNDLDTELWPGPTVAVAKTVGLNHLRFKRFTYAPRLSYAVIE